MSGAAAAGQPEPPDRAAWRSPLLLGLLLFSLALALRLWGLSYGLPHFLSGDEVGKRDIALHLAETGFRYSDPQPGVLVNSLFVVYRIADLFPGQLTDVAYHYLGRLWMAILGALTVLAVWRLGSEVVERDGARVGLFAAVLLAVLPLHSAASRYIKEDAPLALLVTLAVLAAVRSVKLPSRGRLVMAGLLLGVTCSTKFTGVVLLLPILPALVLSARRAGLGAGATAGNLGLFLLCGGVGFFAASPVYLFHPAQLVEALTYQGQYASGGHDGISIGPWKEWWSYYIRTGLIPGMTWPVFALSVAGLVLLARARAGWLVGATAILFYVVLEQSPAKPAPFSARYLMPLVPLLTVAAGLALLALLERLGKWLPPPIAYGLVGAVFVVPPLVRSMHIADEATHDTRFAAGKWMEETLPSGARIVISEDLTNLPISGYWQTQWQVEDRDGTSPLVATWSGRPPPYFVVSSFKYERFLESPAAVPERTAFYERVMHDFTLVKEFRPRWLSYGKHSPVIRIYQPPS